MNSQVCMVALMLMTFFVRIVQISAFCEVYSSRATVFCKKESG